MVANESRRLTAVLLALERGPRHSSNLPSDGFRPLIHWAAWIGRIDLAKRVLALDPDPNAMDMFGYTALDWLGQGGGHGDIGGMADYLVSVGGIYNIR